MSSEESVSVVPEIDGIKVQSLGRLELTDVPTLEHLAQPHCMVGVGVPSHVPSEPVRTLPNRGVPATRGYFVPLTAGGRPMASVVGVKTDDAPLALFAIILS